MTRTRCSACAIGPIADMKYCHECKGRGFIDSYDRVPGCNQREPTCPIVGEAMTGGWICEKCGDSGPL